MIIMTTPQVLQVALVVQVVQVVQVVLAVVGVVLINEEEACITVAYNS